MNDTPLTPEQKEIVQQLADVCMLLTAGIEEYKIGPAVLKRTTRFSKHVGMYYHTFLVDINNENVFLAEVKTIPNTHECVGMVQPMDTYCTLEIIATFREGRWVDVFLAQRKPREKEMIDVYMTRFSPIDDRDSWSYYTTTDYTPPST